jgi:hypothetical protein
MATFDFQLTDQDIGLVIGPENGFLVSLSQTAPSTDRSDPQWSQSLGRWRTGYCTLKGQRDVRPIYSNRSGAWTPLWQGDQRILISNASFPYAGQLVVECVPRGAVYTLTLSDVPVDVALPRRTTFGPHVRNEADGVWGHKS